MLFNNSQLNLNVLNIMRFLIHYVFKILSREHDKVTRFWAGFQSICSSLWDWNLLGHFMTTKSDLLSLHHVRILKVQLFCVTYFNGDIQVFPDINQATVTEFWTYDLTFSIGVIMSGQIFFCYKFVQTPTSYKIARCMWQSVQSPEKVEFFLCRLVRGKFFAWGINLTLNCL